MATVSPTLDLNRVGFQNITIGVKMPSSTTPKINVRNSVNECAQSLKKENAGKYHNYGIKECIASIAASKRK